MTRWHFDLDRIRKNWERANDLPPDEMPARFEAVAPPRDPYQAGRDILARVRSLSSREIERHGATLTPFFGRVEEAIGRLEAAGEKERDEARAELAAALADLEDLLGLFSGITA